VPKTKPKNVPTSKPGQATKRLQFSLAVLIPFIGLVIAWLTLQGNSPTLYESNAVVSREFLTVTITNKGRTAQVGNVWCAAGAYLHPGTAQITKLVNASPEIFRRTAIAPDQQESLQMMVPVTVNPDIALRVFNNPLMLRLNSATIWGVVCNVPYWDSLDRWKWLERDLKFCYEIQPSGTGEERHAVPCTPDELQKTIHALGGPE
jgi:hypothetical protein